MKIGEPNLEQFSALMKRSIANHINDIISDRLSIAIKTEETPEAEPIEVDTTQSDADKIVTTAEELEGYYIVKTILRLKFTANRITYRDALSYFAIFIDDNNRKVVCRLYFNSNTNKQIGIFDDNKKETRYKLQSIDDIYSYSDQLIKSTEKYIQTKYVHS